MGRWFLLVGLAACAIERDGPVNPFGDMGDVGNSPEAGDSGDSGDSGDVRDTGDSDDTAPPLPNSAPVAAIAGPTGDVLPGDSILLDGSSSTDADSDPLTYLWELVGKPSSSSATLSNATSARAELFVDVDGDYIVQLTVDDGQTNDSTTAKLTVLGGNLPPIARAGVDQRVAQFSTVQLNGNQSSDPDGDSLQYYWSFVSTPGTLPSLQGNSNPSTAASPWFVADQLGINVLQLVVGDGSLQSQPDTVVVSVFDPAAPSP